MNRITILSIATVVCVAMPTVAACAHGGSFAAPSATGSDSAPAPATSAPVVVDTGNPDQAYLDLLHSNLVNDPGLSDAQLLAASRGICTDWDDRYTLYETIADAESIGLSAYDSGFLIAAATDRFCPQYNYLTGGN